MIANVHKIGIRFITSDMLRQWYLCGAKMVRVSSWAANATKVIAFACHKEDMAMWQISLIVTVSGNCKWRRAGTRTWHSLEMPSSAGDNCKWSRYPLVVVCTILSTPFYRDTRHCLWSSFSPVSASENKDVLRIYSHRFSQ